MRCDRSWRAHYIIVYVAGMYLALMVPKDISWKKALEGPESAAVIAAFHAEHDDLLDSVLELIPVDHPTTLHTRKSRI